MDDKGRDGSEKQYKKKKTVKQIRQESWREIQKT